MGREDPRRQPVTDVVVVLPGILGSNLVRGGNIVWSSSRMALFRNILKGGGPIYDLALDPECFDGKDPDDGVVAESLIPDTHMIPGLWTIDGYSKLAKAIQRLDGVIPAKNYFEFPYDWRLDNRLAARRLATCTREWLDSWRSTSSNDKAELVLVAHSMGGLISRYFLEVLAGWRDTRSLITVGTPFQGSLQALDFLSNGVRLGPAPLRKLTKVVRSLPSVYQLLPTYKCWSVEDGDFLELSDVSEIPNVEASRVTRARTFHDEIAEAERNNTQLDEYIEKAHRMDPIAGVNQPTLQSAVLDGGAVKALKSYRDLDRNGDGRVMRELATPDKELRGWSVNQRHAALQNDDAVITQITDILSEPTTELRVSIDKLGFGVDVHGELGFGVDVEEVHSTRDPISVRVTPYDELPAMQARLLDAETAEPLANELLHPGDDGDLHASFPSQPPGLYKLIVAGTAIAPVEDLICVVADE